MAFSPFLPSPTAELDWAYGGKAALLRTTTTTTYDDYHYNDGRSASYRSALVLELSGMNIDCLGRYWGAPWLLEITVRSIYILCMYWPRTHQHLIKFINGQSFLLGRRGATKRPRHAITNRDPGAAAFAGAISPRGTDGQGGTYTYSMYSTCIRSTCIHTTS